MTVRLRRLITVFLITNFIIIFVFLVSTLMTTLTSFINFTETFE
jgi:hypothetical protein